MTSTVTQFNYSVNRELIKKLFTKLSSVYGQAWSNRHKSAEEWEECCSTWFDGLKEFEVDVIRKAVAQAFLVHKDFPPTLGQLIDLCLAQAGTPSESEMLNLLVRREFKHPLVKLCYDKIGSWALSNDKETELKSKLSNVYQEAMINFRADPQAQWQKLEEFNKQNEPKALEAPKIPLRGDFKGWRQRLAEWEEMAKAQKVKIDPVEHPAWNKEELVRGSKKFNENTFLERRKYLISLDEYVASTLPHEDQYDRIRFLREIEGVERLKQNGNSQGSNQNKNSSTSFKSSKVVYKEWM